MTLPQLTQMKKWVGITTAVSSAIGAALGILIPAFPGIPVLGAILAVNQAAQAFIHHLQGQDDSTKS